MNKTFLSQVTQQTFNGIVSTHSPRGFLDDILGRMVYMLITIIQFHFSTLQRVIICYVNVPQPPAHYVNASDYAKQYIKDSAWISPA